MFNHTSQGIPIGNNEVTLTNMWDMTRNQPPQSHQCSNSVHDYCDVQSFRYLSQEKAIGISFKIKVTFTCCQHNLSSLRQTKY